MPYITIPVKPKEYQISFEDLLGGMTEEKFAAAIDTNDTKDTRTVYREQTPGSLLEKTNIDGMINALVRFNTKYEDLLNVEDRHTLYHSFKIPKRSGGLRQIDAPNSELMAALRDLKIIFEKKLFASYHTSAFAYVKGRCTIDAIKRHQKNNSRWFLKLDFHDFFGSSTFEFVVKQLEMIFPFNVILSIPTGETALKKALSLCFLDNKLPQGTPMSPTLTNLFMIPIDHQIARLARNFSPHLTYTRYADDIILSSQLSFTWSNARAMVLDTLDKFESPFSLNLNKTRYGSSAGRNWNLGVMLNGNNEITIGHEKKKVFKAMLFSFMSDDKNGVAWSLEDVQHLAGLISYYKMVEAKTIPEIIATYSTKFGKSVEETIKKSLRGNC